MRKIVTIRWQDLMRTPPEYNLLPVRISIGIPKFWPAAEDFDVIHMLCPYGILGTVTEELFEERYCERLEEYGAEKIDRVFSAINRQHEGKTLALACYEDLSVTWCHRRMFAKWWLEQTGEEVPEFTLQQSLEF